MSKPIVLCLSGGGLRATFFHLGVIASLRRRGVLSDVSHIYSISGGSIAAAHVLKNWSRYTGSQADFQSAAEELLGIGQWDIRGRVIRRYIASFLLFPLKILYVLSIQNSLLNRFAGGLTEFLGQQYAQLFKNATFADLYPDNLQKPELHVLTTNLNTGELCEFSRHGYSIHQKGEPTPTLVPVSALPLDLAVSASSAFPPLFPPVKVDRQRLNVLREEDFPHVHRLTDGGVFDNYGVYLPLKEMTSQEKISSAVVISDASAPLDWALTRRFFGPIGRNSRASSILMDRVGDHVFARLKDYGFVDHIVVCSMRDAPTDNGLSVDEQRMLASVRTDLDWFEPAVCHKLALHGQAVGYTKLASNGIGSDAPAIPIGDPTELKRDPAALVRSTIRRFRLVSIDDWVSLPVLLLLVALLVVAPYLVWSANNELQKDIELARTRDAIAVKAKTDEIAKLEAEHKRQIAVLTRDHRIQLNAALFAPKQPQRSACRHPSHGLEPNQPTPRQLGTFDSGWRSGGYSPDRWCADAISQRTATNPGGTIRATARSERSRSRCQPFNCPEYHYTCTLEFIPDPVFVLRTSEACPPAPQ